MMRGLDFLNYWSPTDVVVVARGRSWISPIVLYTIAVGFEYLCVVDTIIIFELFEYFEFVSNVIYYISLLDFYHPHRDSIVFDD